eukprot:SAG31_NODE_3742_length_3930_cov_25.606108_2_plen_351_part_00
MIADNLLTTIFVLDHSQIRLVISPHAASRNNLASTPLSMRNESPVSDVAAASESVADDDALTVPLTVRLENLCECSTVLEMGSADQNNQADQVNHVSQQVDPFTAEQAVLEQALQLQRAVAELAHDLVKYIPGDERAKQAVEGWGIELQKLSRPYTLAFVGSFNVGKSALINAVLRPFSGGTTLLPTRMRPTTAVSVFLHQGKLERHETGAAETKLRYYRVSMGSSERLHSRFHAAEVEQEADEVTEKEFKAGVDLGTTGEGTEQNEDFAFRIIGPLFKPGCFGQYLEQRLTIIDTRGDGDVQSAHHNNGKNAAEAFENFDAVVCVLDAQRIGSAEDAEHLSRVRGIAIK